MITPTSAVYLRVPLELRKRMDAHQRAAGYDTMNSSTIELILRGLRSWESREANPQAEDNQLTP